MLEDNEIFNLLLGMAVVALLAARRSQLPRMRFLYVGFLFLVGSYLFTVAEDYVWPEGLNLAEHLAVLLAALAFVLGFARMARGAPGDEDVSG